jgi:hypothetical protein
MDEKQLGQSKSRVWPPHAYANTDIKEASAKALKDHNYKYNRHLKGLKATTANYIGQSNKSKFGSR